MNNRAQTPPSAPGPITVVLVGAIGGAILGIQSSLLYGVLLAVGGAIGAIFLWFIMAGILALIVYFVGGEVTVNGKQYSRKTNNNES